jgi:anti-anti-sigma factor
LNGGGPLVLDMEFCDYLDSTILSVLVRSMRVWGWRMAIVVPSAARIRRIFELTRLDDALPIFANRDEARLRLTPCP